MGRAQIESEMRLVGIGHLQEVAWAILEPRGKISFIRAGEGDAPSASTSDDDGVA